MRPQPIENSFQTNKYIGQIVVIGVGIMAMLLLTIVRNDLWEQWQVSLPADTPNHFLINILPQELPALEQWLARRQWSAKPETKDGEHG